MSIPGNIPNTTTQYASWLAGSSLLNRVSLSISLISPSGTPTGHSHANCRLQPQRQRLHPRRLRLQPQRQLLHLRDPTPRHPDCPLPLILQHRLQLILQRRLRLPRPHRTQRRPRLPLALILQRQHLILLQLRHRLPRQH